MTDLPPPRKRVRPEPRRQIPSRRNLDKFKAWAAEANAAYAAHRRAYREANPHRARETLEEPNG